MPGSVMGTKSYEYHPLAKKFPRMAPDVFKAFCADIAERGLDKPIELLDGMIFDGRHRYEACLQVGIAPRFIELAEDTEAEPYGRAANVFRRHLTQEELAAWLVRKRNGEVEKDRENKDKPTAGISRSAPSNRQLAKAAGIDSRAVDRADAIDKKAAPELKAAIEEGAVKPTDAAKILDRSPAVQAKAVERVKAGQARTVREAVKGQKGTARKARAEYFKPLTDLLSRITKELDKLNRAVPGGKFFKQAENGLEAAAVALRDWKNATR